MLGLVEAVAIELVIAEIATGGSLLLSAGKTADISVLLKEVNILSKEEMALVKGGGIGEDNVTLFRNFGPNELNSILETSGFSVSEGGFGGKQFWIGEDG